MIDYHLLFQKKENLSNNLKTLKNYKITVFFLIFKKYFCQYFKFFDFQNNPLDLFLTEIILEFIF